MCSSVAKRGKQASCFSANAKAFASNPSLQPESVVSRQQGVARSGHKGIPRVVQRRGCGPRFSTVHRLSPKVATHSMKRRPQLWSSVVRRVAVSAPVNHWKQDVLCAWRETQDADLKPASESSRCLNIL